MSLRRSGGLVAALFLTVPLVGFAAGCSSNNYRDINYGSDLGRGWVPEVGDAAGDADGAASETPVTDTASGSGGSSGTGGTSATGTGGAPVDAGGDTTDDAGADGASDALDNG